MTFKTIMMLLVLVLLGACYTPPKLETSEVRPGNYILDPAHTSVIWSVKHAGLSNYSARFDTISGQLSFDPKNPERSFVDIRIDPQSVNTGDAEFDQEIANKKAYFGGDTFGEISFISTKIIITGEHSGHIIGDLTFRGQRQSITLETVFNGAGRSFGHKGKTLGFSATTKFNRSAFGLTHLINFGIGDEISLTIEAEFNEA